MTLCFWHLHLDQLYLSAWDRDLAWVTKNHFTKDRKCRKLLRDWRYETCGYSVYSRGNDVMMNLSDEIANRTENTAEMGFLTDEHQRRHVILKVKRLQIWYRSTKSIKRQPVMAYVAQTSKRFMNKKMPSNLNSRSSKVNQLCPRSHNCIRV